MEQREGNHPKSGIDDLLLNGFWKSTRAQSTTRTPTRSANRSANPPLSDSTKPKTSQRKPSRGTPPPPPSVEDEVDSLAKEHLGEEIRASHIKGNEPPFRGTVDQQPIILESDISKADAKKLHNKLNAEIKAEDTGERRFVLVPRGDTHSPVHDDDERPRRSYTDPKSSTPKQGERDKRTSRTLDVGPTPLQRRGSRQDLPSLQTEIPPPFRRSTSAYAYTPTTKQSAKSTAAPDYLLSPEVATARGQPKGYFDIGTPRQAKGNVSTPVAEKRKSAGSSSSRPTTPEKRHSTGTDAYARPRQDLPEKLTRPQQLSTESGARRTDRAPSAHTPSDGAENTRHRKSSSQSSRRHYSSSDDDDSSDSDRRRRRHRHHHHRHNGNASLHPDSDRDRHHRSGSKSTRSSDGKPGSRISSPLASPNVSPSQLPPIDRVENLRSANYTSSRESRRPNSRPVSPLSAYPDSPRADTLDPKDPGRSRARSRPRSRRSSPVATPGTRNPANMSTATLPIPIPTRIDLHSPGDTRRSPSIPQYDEDPRTARPSTSQKPFGSWQPAPFQPPSENLDKPVGYYRRYSEDLSSGTIAPLPPCPRTFPTTRTHTDWLTLPRHPSFNICPSCFTSTIAPTEFHAHFVSAPARPPSSPASQICDFGSQPWYRIAWLLTRKDRRRDLGLMTSLAKINESIPPCNGKHEAVRKWYGTLDPGTGKPVRNFDVCGSCVRSIETLLPVLQRVFIRTDQLGPPGLPRVCDMRFDSKRFVHYFDALETAADSAALTDDEEPDLSEFVSLAKRFATIPECPRDDALDGTYWYTITQLPEFTVCPECFDEVVRPGLENGQAIPKMFGKDSKMVREVRSCQLYSEKMRSVFSKATEGNDYMFLAGKARERVKRENDWRRGVEEAKRAGKTLGKGEGEAMLKRAEVEWEKWE